MARRGRGGEAAGAADERLGVSAVPEGEAQRERERARRTDDEYGGTERRAGEAISD